MFQKRHYEAIAQAVQSMQRHTASMNGGTLPWDTVRDELADLFERNNSRFDRDRFMRACQPGANVRARTLGD